MSYIVYAISDTLRPNDDGDVLRTGFGGHAFEEPIVDCTSGEEPHHVWLLIVVNNEEDMFFLTRKLAEECGTIREARDLAADWKRENERVDQM